MHWLFNLGVYGGGDLTGLNECPSVAERLMLSSRNSKTAFLKFVLAVLREQRSDAQVNGRSEFEAVQRGRY